MENRPDRYTVVNVAPSELAKAIIDARGLGLRWFVMDKYDTKGELLLHLFFDTEGMNAYLKGEYDDKGS